MTSELDLVPATKSRAALVVGALLVAAAGAATYVVVVRRGASREPSEVRTAGVAAGSAATARGVGPASLNPVAPTAAATVTIRFEAEPAGVHVYRATDEKDLGAAPLELTLPRHGGKPAYIFRREGYRDQTLTADLEADRTLRATLEKAAPPPAAPARASDGERDRAQDGDPEEAAPRPGASKKSRSEAREPRKPARSNSMDQDGLATPTF
jgi:hypothetical protein